MATTASVTADFSNAAWTKTGGYAHGQDPTRGWIDVSTSNSIRTAVGYDLTNSSFSFKNVWFPGANIDFEMRAANGSGTVFRVIGNANNTGTFSITNGTTTGVTTFTNAVGKANPYWRWRHSGTTMTFECASDAAFTSIGFTWSQTPGIAITDLYLWFFQTQTGIAAQGSWTFQEVNGAAAPTLTGAQLINSGIVSEGTASTTPAPPNDVAAGDLMTMTIVNRPNTVTPTTPSGWTQVHTGAVGAAVAEGAGVGPVRVTVLQREATAAETAGVAVTVTGGLVSVGIITAYRKSNPASTWSLAAGGVTSLTTAVTAWSAVSAALACAPGDIILASNGISDDTGATAHGFTGTGLTFSGVSKRFEHLTTGGNDEGMIGVSAYIATGTTSVALTHTMTLAAAEYGGTSFVRVREVASAVAVAFRRPGKRRW